MRTSGWPPCATPPRSRRRPSRTPCSACWTMPWPPARSAFSTGLAYQPGGAAQPPELEGLARVAAARGAMHTSHIRNEGDDVEAAVDEVLSVGRNTGCATVLSHHKCMLPRNWGKSRATLANIDRARGEGVDVALDIYPHPGSSTIPIPRARRDHRRHSHHLVHPAPRVRRRIPERHRRPLGLRQDHGGAPPVPRGRHLLRHGRGRGPANFPARALHGRLRRAAQRRASTSAPVGQLHPGAGPLCARSPAADAGGGGRQ